MPELISMFKGEYSFLSNFYPAIVQYEGLSYPTVEHAYQASKSTEFFFRKLLACLPAKKAGVAKQRGRTIRLRKDWDEIKIDVMFELLCDKFKKPEFKDRLLATKGAKLVEGNYWHDNIWGDCLCKKCSNIEGQNWLGRLLTEVRSQINERHHCYRGYTC